jgi:hypothetical protein
MKYHKFNRRGRYDLFVLHTYIKSKKKQTYMVNTKRSKLLHSFYFENQAWGALAKNKDEYDKMELYARRIQELQHDLGLEVSSFNDIGMSAEDFLSPGIRNEVVAEFVVRYGSFKEKMPTPKRIFVVFVSIHILLNSS